MYCDPYIANFYRNLVHFDHVLNTLHDSSHNAQPSWPLQMLSALNLLKALCTYRSHYDMTC